MRWSLLLQEYSFTIEYCPGKENFLADFLSRHPDGDAVRPALDEGRMLMPENDFAPEALQTLTTIQLIRRRYPGTVVTQK